MSRRKRGTTRREVRKSVTRTMHYEYKLTVDHANTPIIFIDLRVITEISDETTR